MKVICRSKMSSVSSSKPTMKPLETSMPWAWMRRTVSSRSSLALTGLLAPIRLSTEGVSIPRNTMPKPASRISRISSASAPRLTEASVKKLNGKSWLRCQRSIAINECLASRRFPMKLSSTKNTEPRHPAASSASSSAVIRSGDLIRERRPYSFQMSQNSQANGQPRECCTAIEA